MKPLRLTLLLLVVLCPRVHAQVELINGIMAIVNDAVITIKDVQIYIRPGVELKARQYAAQPKLFEQEMLKLQRDGLEQLVERRLILDEFKTLGYPEAIITDEVNKQVRRDIRENFEKSRLKFIKSLQEEGVTVEKYREQVRDRLIVYLLTARNISDELVVSPHKMEQFYAANQDKYKREDEVKLRMIFLSRPKSGDAAPVKQLAEEILAKIKEGASFAEMASLHSEGSQRAQGGDWDWVERSVLRQDLADAAFQLEKGQLSPIIEAKDGFYLMLVEDKRPSRVRPLSEVRENIESELRDQEKARLRKKWIDKLRAKSFVRYF